MTVATTAARTTAAIFLLSRVASIEHLGSPLRRSALFLRGQSRCKSPKQGNLVALIAVRLVQKNKPANEGGQPNDGVNRANEKREYGQACTRLQNSGRR